MWRGVTSVAGVLAVVNLAAAEPLPVRVVAANLTSGNHQAYSPDNGNHSNPEGAGARILEGLKPDVALVQEFNTTVPARQWVNATFGQEFAVFVEPTGQTGGIPNGIVSRWPIVESGEWDDASQTNREFAWAKIALPNGKFLWAISVHLYSKKPAVRADEAKALRELVRTKIPPGDLVVLGGDFNTRERGEACMDELAKEFDAKGNPPVDAAGDAETNAPRNKPYDWVLADPELAACAAPTRIGSAEFPQGMVFDSRAFQPLADVAPVQAGDSAAPNMQHMAVVRDFLVK
jgi:endonuclease/exonuclease/phosphatase family metal-dependent hydrolase